MAKIWFAAVATAGFAMAPMLAHGADAAKGERVFQQCKTCHTLEKGAKSGVGPNLAGVLGRKAGTLDGFAYSEAMKAADIVWDESQLAEYIKDPKKRIPGNKMVFIGLKKEDQIDDVIAYLKKASQ